MKALIVMVGEEPNVLLRTAQVWRGMLTLFDSRPWCKRSDVSEVAGEVAHD